MAITCTLKLKRVAIIFFAPLKILINIEKLSFIIEDDYFYKRVFLCNFKS